MESFSGAKEDHTSEILADPGVRKDHPEDMELILKT